MGIITGAILLVGLPYEEVVESEIYEELIDWELKQEWLEDNLTSASPYYDSDKDHRFYGVVVAAVNWTYTEVDDITLTKRIDDAKARFKQITGLDGYLALSANVW